MTYHFTLIYTFLRHCLLFFVVLIILFSSYSSSFFSHLVVMNIWVAYRWRLNYFLFLFTLFFTVLLSDSSIFSLSLETLINWTKYIDGNTDWINYSLLTLLSISHSFVFYLTPSQLSLHNINDSENWKKISVKMGNNFVNFSILVLFYLYFLFFFFFSDQIIIFLSLLSYTPFFCILEILC